MLCSRSGWWTVAGGTALLGIVVAPSTAWEILKQAGIDPAPRRQSTTWARFLHSQAEVIVACGFFETVTLAEQKISGPSLIEHATRRIRILGSTAHPTAAWMAQSAKSLILDLEDVEAAVR